jgi:hypothetical protein
MRDHFMASGVLANPSPDDDSGSMDTLRVVSEALDRSPPTAHTHCTRSPFVCSYSPWRVHCACCRSPYGRMGNMITLSIEDCAASETPSIDTMCKGSRHMRNVHMVPYPSLFHDGLGGPLTGPAGFPWRHDAGRPARASLAFYAAGGHGNSASLRSSISTACESDTRCFFHLINNSDGLAHPFNAVRLPHTRSDGPLSQAIRHPPTLK